MDPGQSFVVTQLNPKSLPGFIIDSRDSSGPAVGGSWTIDLNGLLGSMESAKIIAESEIGKKKNNMDLDGEPDLDSFPILVRSMSTSRRHSWGVPISPINLGRRLSLDTDTMDSSGDRDEDEDRDSLFKSTELQTVNCTASPSGVQGDKPDGPKLKVPCPRARVISTAPGAVGRHLFSHSDILTTDQHSRAAHVSHVVQTSKQAARAAGEELDPEENLQSTEGQCHIAKQRNNSVDAKGSGNVTWYEFLSNENEEEEEDHCEKVEKGTKVKRRLSSLRNRMTGSFNKDKGKNRDKEQQREKGKEREAKEKDKVCSRNTSSNSSNSPGHHLVPGAFSSCATCSLCSKTLQKKHGLQCMSE